ncbi:MAG: hypothetical protein DRG31_07675, partial [Deltaproteobacteria bacterium]
GLSDYEEVAHYGSKPNEKDSDGDTLPDGLEVGIYGTSPGEADTDGDGISDAEEMFTYFTDPKLRDTDQDGAGDYEEVERGTDPLDLSSKPSEFVEVDDIRDLQVRVSSGEAVIRFTTGKSVRARILYGESRFYAGEVVEEGYTITHELVLEGLRPGTRYHYFIILEEESGYSEGTYDRMFRTREDSDDTTAPVIEVIFPKDGSGTTASVINVTGRVDDRYAEIKVNGREAILSGKNFYFKGLQLEPGWNTIEIRAKDTAGNTSIEETSVYYSKAPSVKITSSNIPEGSIQGVPEQFEGTWEGENARILINGKECKVYTDGTWVGPKNISELEAKELGIGEDDNDYLIIRPGITALHITISNDGTPIEKTLSEGEGGGGSAAEKYEEVKLFEIGGIPVSGFTYFSGSPFYIERIRIEEKSEYSLNIPYDPKGIYPVNKRYRYKIEEKYGGILTKDSGYTDEIPYKEGSYFEINFIPYGINMKYRSGVTGFTIEVPSISGDRGEKYPLSIVLRDVYFDTYGGGQSFPPPTTEPWEYRINNCILAEYGDGSKPWSKDYYIVFKDYPLKSLYPLQVTKRPYRCGFIAYGDGYFSSFVYTGWIDISSVEILPLVDLQADIDGDRDIDEDDQNLEIEKPGLLIPINDDDDDKDDIIDIKDTDNTEEDDLIRCYMVLSSYITKEGKVILQRMNDKIKVWRDREKKDLLLPNITPSAEEDESTVIWDLAVDSDRQQFLRLRDSLFIEGYEVSDESGDTGLVLTYRPIRPLSGGVLEDIVDTMMGTVVKVEKVELVSGATVIGDGENTPDNLDICAAIKADDKNVIVKAILVPNIPETTVSADFIKWSDGEEVEGHPLQRKVTRSNWKKYMLQASTSGITEKT